MELKHTAMDPTQITPMPFFARLWFAWVAYFRILTDATFAARVRAAQVAAPPALAPAALSERPALPKPPESAPALQLLALLQREGRLVDFLEQEVTGFSDSDVGAAARVVHEGCRKALRSHATLTTVRSEEEGATVSVPVGFDAAETKLIGNVRGAGPFQGKLVHRGWRADKFRLPTPVQPCDPAILAPAEVELPG